MPNLPPSELARRALPWVLMSKFKNVVKELPSLGRVIEVWTSAYAGIFVPAAAKFLYVPQPAGGEKLYEAEVNRALHYVRFRYGPVAKVEGYLPFTGEKRVIKAETALKTDWVSAKLVGDGEPSPVSIDIMARDILRVRAAPIFGGHVLNVLEKHLNARVYSGPRLALKPVELQEGIIEYEFSVPLRLHTVELGDGSRVRAPSVVAAAVALIGSGRVEPLLDEKGVERLEGFLARVYEQGSRVYPVSGAVLHSTRRASFTYIIGRVARKPSEWVQLGKAASRGALLKIYATPRGDLVARISILPFNPPAVIVLNYPPFTAAPLVAMLHEKAFTEAIEKAVTERGREYGAEHWLGEYQPLADARVYVSTVRAVLREGYPRLATLEDVMDRLEPVGRIGDIMRMALAPADVREKLLVEELRPVERRVERNPGEEDGEIAEVL